MATAQITLNYPADYTSETDGDGVKLLPSGLLWNGTDYSGSDGEYDVFNVSPTGQWTHESVVIGEVLADGSDTITLIAPSGHSLITIPQDYDPYILQNWDTQPKVGGKLVYDNEGGTTELNSEPNLVKTDSDVLEMYYVDPDTGEWYYAPITWANLPVSGEPVDQVPQGTIAIGAVTKDHESATVEFTYDEDDADSFEYRVNGGTWAAATSPISLSDLSELTQYTVSVRPVNEHGTGTVEDIVFTTDEAPAVPQPPQGTVTIGTITVDHESASIPFSYNDSDQTGFEHSVNGSAWTVVTSPITRDNLNPETTYSGEIRAVNADGSGQAVSYTFTTDAEPASVPQGLITFGTASVAATSWSLPFSYSMDDADGFEYRINGGNWIDAISPVSMYNADPETSYTVDVRPYNAQGTGNVLSAIITTTADNTDPQPDETVVERVYTIEAYKNRMPDIQRFAMYQGDRVRLMVEHNFDLAGKQLLFRLAPKKGAPARFTLTSENDQFVITSAMAEELAVSNKVWQLILKENESRVVVGEGAVDIRYRIKE